MVVVVPLVGTFWSCGQAYPQGNRRYLKTDLVSIYPEYGLCHSGPKGRPSEESLCLSLERWQKQRDPLRGDKATSRVLSRKIALSSRLCGAYPTEFGYFAGLYLILDVEKEWFSVSNKPSNDTS